MSNYVSVPVIPKPATAPVEPAFASAEEAAAFLNLSRTRIYKMARLKHMPHRKFGATIRIPWAWLREQDKVDGWQTSEETVTNG